MRVRLLRWSVSSPTTTTTRRTATKVRFIVLRPQSTPFLSPDVVVHVHNQNVPHLDLCNPLEGEQCEHTSPPKTFVVS